MKRFFIIGILAATVFTAGCSNKSGKGDTDFSFWIYNGADSSYYTDYKDNPSLKYALDKTWGEQKKTINLDFWIPAGGTAADNYQTMLGSGDYADLIDGSISNPADEMYNDGIILDLTDYIDQYMPNYKALLESNPDIAKEITYHIDGEDRVLALSTISDALEPNWCGYMYRRDWIVTYGTNPATGEKFTGGYSDTSDPDSWTDDVIFPSGSTDPVTISDWEWMFAIFTKAQEALKIEDSYSISLYYLGYLGFGALESSFGGGNLFWSIDQGGQVQLGLESERCKAYLECMNTWYEKGWLDQSFNERTADSFFAIDDTSVRQGKVGMWIGYSSQFGNRMDTGDELTSGICVYGASIPINDVYGDETTKNMKPDCVLSSSVKGVNYFISTAAKDKDLAALCTFLDYFYSEEGALLHTLGLSKDQYESSQNALYKKWGLTEGAYTILDNGKYQAVGTIANDGGGLGIAAIATKMPGLTLVKEVDKGYQDTFAHSLDLWGLYENSGGITTTITSHIASDDLDQMNSVTTKLREYTSQAITKFIKGESDIDSDSDWNTWCKTVEKYNCKAVTDIYQKYVDKLQ